MRSRGFIYIFFSMTVDDVVMMMMLAMPYYLFIL